MTQHIRNTVMLAMAICIAAASAFAAAPAIGKAVDVAPEVEETRLQKWPRAAWAAVSKCWLVVWREGVVGEGETDIWCARVGEDGKAMDPAGIRITTSPGVKDRPVVASDGKDFLVAWNDVRNGKDWDVYASRVTAEGKVRDSDGFVVADGEHNQCSPSVVFAEGTYLLAWQGFVEKAMQYKKRKGLQMDFGSYETRGARISPEGKVLDAGGKVLAALTAIQPTLGVDADGKVWLTFIGHVGTRLKGDRTRHFPAIVRIDAAACAPVGEARPLGVTVSSKFMVREYGGGGFPPSVAFVKDGGGIVSGRGYLGGTTLFRFDKDGNGVGEGIKVHNGMYRHLAPVSTLASDGERIILVRDWPHTKNTKRKGNMGVRASMLSPEGEFLEGGIDGFPIDVEAGKDRVQSFVGTGPEGAFLVVYAVPRGVEDTKVVARILR